MSFARKMKRQNVEHVPCCCGCKMTYKPDVDRYICFNCGKEKSRRSK